jgi:hypothetical protein
MASNRNRTAGHNYERQLVKEFKELGYGSCCTSRSESKNRDDAGVDLCYSGPWNVQAKYTKNAPNMHTLLDSMPKEEGQINVVFHKRKNVGETVTMTKKDFYRLEKGLDI